MGCYRVYAHGRSADLHNVSYELETATRTMKVEPLTNSGAVERPRGYMHNINSVFRLASDHVCNGMDPWQAQFNPIDELYIDKGDDRGGHQ